MVTRGRVCLGELFPKVFLEFKDGCGIEARTFCFEEIEGVAREELEVSFREAQAWWGSCVEKEGERGEAERISWKRKQ